MSIVNFEKLGPGALTVGESGTTKDFSARCSEVFVKPDLPEGDGNYLLDGSETADSDATFGTLEFEFYQDYTLNGFTAWTYTNAGKVLPFSFTPSNKGQIKVTGKVKVKPVDIGGKPNKANTTKAAFPIVEGLPQIVNKG